MEHPKNYIDYNIRYLNHIRKANKMAAMLESLKVHHMSFINTKECPLLDYIKNGVKTVEGRKNSSKYQNIRVGDTIVIHTEGEDDVQVEVVYVRKYTTLEEYLDKEGFDIAIPCAKDKQDAIRIYNQWSSEDVRENLRKQYGYGFLGIGIKVVG